MSNNAVTTSDWIDFKNEVVGIASTFAKLRNDCFDHTPPQDVVRDLKAVEKALTTALQKILPLQLEHQDGQDIIAEPFNWPVVQALVTARDIKYCTDNNSAQNAPAYPSDLISGLREFRDIARFALEAGKTGKGNSTRRNPSSARKADLAKNFVFRFRSRFGFMPPITKTGREVKLLEKMFEVAGETPDTADDHLRRAIENDTAGRELLPSARTAKTPKRDK